MPQANPWPPRPFDIALAKFAEWDALYIGDAQLLTDAFGQTAAPTHVHNGVPYTGGLVGNMASKFWGTPSEVGESRPQIHVPLPADLAQLSADLVFAEPPKFTLPDSAGQNAQDRLDYIMGSDHAHAELLKAGEYAAALGGAYLALIWDQTFSDIDHVWFRAFSADLAIPEFKYGRLYSVRLWSEFKRENGDIFRLIEAHAPGSITYQLWQGNSNDLGYQVDVRAIEETSHVIGLLPAYGVDVLPQAETLDVVLETGTQKLTVKYFPNMLPQRNWRKAGQLANLGRSDFDGVEHMFNEIDRTVSSLINDVELGQGRITVPEDYLENLGIGMGASFDLRRRLYSGLNILDQHPGGGNRMEVTQFEIRVQEHLDTISALTRMILRNTGYSPSSFGDPDSGARGAITATEVDDRKNASERTRDKKIMYVTPALAELAQVALEIDAYVYPGKGGGIFDRPDVEFPDVSQVDLEKVGREVVMFDSVGAMSMWEKVSARNPKWDDEQIKDELKKIKQDKEDAMPPALADPTKVGARLDTPVPPPPANPDEPVVDQPEEE